MQHGACGEAKSWERRENRPKMVSKLPYAPEVRSHRDPGNVGEPAGVRGDLPEDVNQGMSSDRKHQPASDKHGEGMGGEGRGDEGREGGREGGE